MADDDIKEIQVEKRQLKQQEDRDDLGRVSSGIQGNRMDKGFVQAGEGYFSANSEKSDKDYQFFEMVISEQERMHRQFLASITEARKFSEHAGNQIDRHIENLNKIKADLKDNTITLSNSLSVYKEGDDFYYQGVDNQWHLLKNENLIDDATEKELYLIAQGKIPATREDKENIDLYETDLLDADKTREDLDNMNDQFEKNVENGEYNPEEKNAVEQKKNELEQKLNKFENTHHQLTNKYAANPTSVKETTELYGDMDQSIFSTAAVEEPHQSGISSADPVIKSDVQLSGDFKMASNGDIKEQEQQPSVDFKEQKIMPLQAPTVS